MVKKILNIYSLVKVKIKMRKVDPNTKQRTFLFLYTHIHMCVNFTHEYKTSG